MLATSGNIIQSNKWSVKNDCRLPRNLNARAATTTTSQRRVGYVSRAPLLSCPDKPAMDAICQTINKKKMFHSIMGAFCLTPA